MPGIGSHIRCEPHHDLICACLTGDLNLAIFRSTMLQRIERSGFLTDLRNPALRPVYSANLFRLKRMIRSRVGLRLLRTHHIPRTALQIHVLQVMRIPPPTRALR